MMNDVLTLFTIWNYLIGEKKNRRLRDKIGNQETK